MRSKPLIPFDLHVLGTPPAFVLSQDQTLQFYTECLKLITQMITDKYTRNHYFTAIRFSKTRSASEEDMYQKQFRTSIKNFRCFKIFYPSDSVQQPRSSKGL